MGASAKSEDGGAASRRLREFLRSLPVDTCIRIMEALEQAKIAGESFPGADMISAELVAVVSAQRRRAPRTTTLSASFSRCSSRS